MLNLLNILKNISVPQLRLKSCKPFIVAKTQVGLISPEVSKELSKYPEVFQVASDHVGLNYKLNSYQGRSEAIESVLVQMKNQGIFPTLNGWRNEYYEVKSTFDVAPLLRIDRSCTCLFGIKNYGIVVNGYVQHPTLGLCLWLQRRSSNRQRWAGKWDLMVGGGITAGQSVLEAVYRECLEEASVSEEYHQNIRSVGTVSAVYENNEGIFPSTAFIFDLQLPHSFKPTNVDGEVDFFRLVPVPECLEIIERGTMKKPIILAVLDFFVRHSVITPNENPYYVAIVETLHSEVQKLYEK